MALPTVKRPYPLGPWSVVDSAGTRYWFPSAFKASHLIPGEAAEEMIRGEDEDDWQAAGDGERLPDTLTLTGTMIAFSTIAGLHQDVATLRAALENAVELHRANPDGTSLEITIDGGQVTVGRPKSPHAFPVTVTLYPTSGEVTTGVAATPPTLRNRITTDGNTRITTDGETRVAVG